MKLYYATGTCSLSPHIVLKELNLPYTLVKTDIRKKVTESGASFLEVNPKGQVPVLQLDSGEVLTEGVAIIQYLADLAPEKGLVPRANSWEKYKLLEWLNFITSELHKGYSPLFDPTLGEEGKAAARTKIGMKFKHLEKVLTASTYLMGESFTVADAYLFTVLGWSDHAKVALPEFLKSYQQSVSSRPAVQAALKEEGMV